MLRQYAQCNCCGKLIEISAIKAAKGGYVCPLCAGRNMIRERQ